jgi:hypothetical protein
MYVYTVHLVWEGGRGGGQREGKGAAAHKSIVPSSMGVTVQKLSRKYQP